MKFGKGTVRANPPLMVKQLCDHSGSRGNSPLVEVPDIQYTRSGDVAVAYQVVGDGPVDVVWFRGMAGDLLSTWDQPLIVRHAIGLSAFSRLLGFDKRGTGLPFRPRS